LISTRSNKTVFRCRFDCPTFNFVAVCCSQLDIPPPRSAVAGTIACDVIDQGRIGPAWLLEKCGEVACSSLASPRILRGTQPQWQLSPAENAPIGTTSLLAVPTAKLILEVAPRGRTRPVAIADARYATAQSVARWYGCRRCLQSALRQ
jgi:hypothetical protein